MRANITICRNLAVAVLLVGCLGALTQAATIGHWRFEDTPGFLVDSSGNGNTLSVSGTVAQVTLPSGGRGVDFPNPVPNTSETNASAADFEGTNDTLSHATLSSVPSTNATLEAFLHWEDSVNNDESFADVIMTTRNGGNPGLAFQIRTDGFAGSDATGELALTARASGVNHFVQSGFSPDFDTDYYFAAAFDMTGGQVTFYVKDLTAGSPLQTFVVGHGATGTLEVAALLEIGNAGFSAGGFDFDGLIDEVRLSDVLLSESQLLINEVPVPEPSSFLLLGMGALGLGRLTRRSRRKV